MTDDRELSDYLLGELPERRRLRFERRLADEPELALEVERLREVVIGLKGLPTDAWDQVPARIEQPQRPPRARSIARPPLAARLAGALALGLTLIAIGFFAGRATTGTTTPTIGGPTVALRALAAAPADAHGTASLSPSGTLEMTVERLPPTARGDFYEAWLMTSAQDLQPLASFAVGAGGTATVRVRLPAPAHA